MIDGFIPRPSEGSHGCNEDKTIGRDRSWRDARGEKRRREQDRGLRPPTWDRENKGLDRDPRYRRCFRFAPELTDRSSDRRAMSRLLTELSSTTLRTINV